MDANPAAAPRKASSVVSERVRTTDNGTVRSPLRCTTSLDATLPSSGMRAAETSMFRAAAMRVRLGATAALLSSLVSGMSPFASRTTARRESPKGPCPGTANVFVKTTTWPGPRTLVTTSEPSTGADVMAAALELVPAMRRMLATHPFVAVRVP